MNIEPHSGGTLFEMEKFSSSLSLFMKNWSYTYFFRQITSHLFPLRKKKESIGLGEELVVSHSDADPPNWNG